MRRSQRLQVVLEQSRRREQDALNRLAAAQERLQAQRTRLDELERYHADYQNQLREVGQGRLLVSRLQSLQRFISQLALAIQQQQQAVTQFERMLEDARRGWQEAHERRRGMERFIDECRREEEHQIERKEQQHLDEAAMQAFVRRQRDS